MRERDDRCEWCGAELVWVGSIAEGRLMCPDCVVDDDDDDLVEDNYDAGCAQLDTGCCPECGTASSMLSGIPGALICQNIGCDVVAFKDGIVLSWRHKVRVP